MVVVKREFRINSMKYLVVIVNILYLSVVNKWNHI